MLVELSLNLSFASWPQKSYLTSVNLIFIISKTAILIIHYSCLQLNQTMQVKQNTWHQLSFLCDIYILTPTHSYKEKYYYNLLPICQPCQARNFKIYLITKYFFLITDQRMVLWLEKICSNCINEKCTCKKLECFLWDRELKINE